LTRIRRNSNENVSFLSSAKVTECVTNTLFGTDIDPVAGLMISVIATFLFNPNIGTTVTNAIVGTGQIGMTISLNVLPPVPPFTTCSQLYVCGHLLPPDVVPGYLYCVTKAMTPDTVSEGDKSPSPVKKIVAPLAKLIIKSNSKLIETVASSDEDFSSFYPFKCINNEETYAACGNNVGLVS
jgi:hypothetical protein